MELDGGYDFSWVEVRGEIRRVYWFFFSSRRRHTRCALVTGFRRVLFRSLQPLGAVDLHRSAADDPGVIRLRLQNRACQQFAIYGSHEFQVDAAPLARPEDRLKPADKRPWHARRHLDGLILGTKGGDEAFKLLTAAKQRQPRPQQCRGQPVGRAPPTRIQDEARRAAGGVLLKPEGQIEPAVPRQPLGDADKRTPAVDAAGQARKSTRLNSSHSCASR